MPSAFELHVRRDAEWTIDTIFRDRDQALQSAQELASARPLMPVRVIAEVFDPETGRGASTIIYELPRRPAAAAAAPPAGRPAEAIIGRSRSSPPRRKPGLAASLTMLALAIGGAGLVFLLALAWFSGLVRL